jgi:hypothetical protein
VLAEHGYIPKAEFEVEFAPLDSKQEKILYQLGEEVERLVRQAKGE